MSLTPPGDEEIKVMADLVSGGATPITRWAVLDEAEDSKLLTRDELHTIYLAMMADADATRENQFIRESLAELTRE